MFLIGCLISTLLVSSQDTDEVEKVEPQSRFEFEFSFKGPYIAQTDGLVPFWSYHGHAIAGDENVRLAPSLRSRQGSIWTKKMFEKEWFEIEVVIRISGRGKIGADGMAIWFTTEGAPTQNDHVPIYGARDKWDGLGIILDSFDNNAKGDNPIIMLHQNDGSKNYNHNQDGGGEELGGCRRDFRNKPYPVKLKLRYYKNTLSLHYHGGVTEFDDYELCSFVENVELPKSGYFGISAATGGLSDDHDVLKFITHSLQDPVEEAPTESPEEKELREKMEEEIKEKQEKYDKEKEKFAEENPDLVAQMEDTLGLAGDNDPQFKAIFDVQNHIQGHIIEILAAINEAKGMIEKIPTQAVHPAPTDDSSPPTTTSQPVVQSGSDTATLPPNIATKNDIISVEEKQAKFTQELQDLASMLRDIQQKTHTIFQNQKPDDATAEMQKRAEHKREQAVVNDSLNNIKQDLQQMVRRQEMLANKACPPQTPVSCVSGTFFVIVSLLQGGLIGFIIYYKMSQEAAAKKFF